MNITKRKLAQLEMVYSVCSIQISGKTHFLAATESYGKCLLFSPPDWKASVVWDGPGGSMNLVPIPKGERAFLAIQEFFPIFQSQKAGIVYVEANNVLTKPWRVRRVLALPFVHRLGVVMVGSHPYIIVATLCGGKDFQDDWSKPGAVYAGALPEDPLEKWSIQPILQGVSKNHGMHVTNIEERAVVLITGQEGVFSIYIPRDPAEEWHHKRLIDNEVSDIYTADIDGDGVLEIITIEPFHGDRLGVYKHLSGSWKAVFAMSINFGHVVWSGNILGRPAILVGNRGGAKELGLLYPKTHGSFIMDLQVLDEQIGPAQIAVVHRQDCDLILSANHDVGEIVLYELKL